MRRVDHRRKGPRRRHRTNSQRGRRPPQLAFTRRMKLQFIQVEQTPKQPAHLATYSTAKQPMQAPKRSSPRSARHFVTVTLWRANHQVAQPNCAGRSPF
jgi:hypothetical protein